MLLKFDYDKLKGRIKARYGSFRKFARDLGLSPKTLSQKLNNKAYFKQSEMTKILYLLDIDLIWAKEYFFELKIQ